MNNAVHRFLALAFILFATGVTADAQRKIPTAEEMLSFNGSLGKEFWITVPPNEINPFPVDALEVYVASAFDTEITVFDAAGDKTFTRKLTAGQIKTLSDKTGETNWTWEIREYEQVVRKAIRITSEHPISVYVLNAKVTTSDGYLAIPTASWGKKYIATTYYDFREYAPWACGFAIISKSNGTVVNIQLKGTGKGIAKTSGGKNIGDMWTVSMDEGTIYCVVGDGTSRGEFDLTGSTVTANQPIGLISFHQRTTMPNMLTNGNGRDHLVEMTPPVETWGKKYVSVEYNRDGTNPNAKGDVFRVTSSEANTKWNLKYYDKTNKAPLGNGGGVLANAGDFADISQSAGPTFLTHGYSVWEADKPIFVTQYACSASFDGDNVHDPFMINVVPEEQFIPGTIFQTPTDPKFFKHNLNLIVWADVNDPDYVDNLRSLQIDGIAVWNHPQSASPTLLFNHMGDNLHWVNINFGTVAQAHTITGNGKVKFGGYIYGYGQVDSYGWPAASGFKPTGIVDTLPPVLTYDEECGDYTYQATELRNIPDPPLPEPIDTDQVDQGIADIQFVAGANNFNYRIVKVTSEEFPRDPPFYRFDFRLEVIDKSKDAYAEFYVIDWFDNVTYDTVQFYADDLAFNPDPVEFGELRLGTKKQLDVAITNNSDGQVVLKESKMEFGDYYTIVAGGLPPEITLDAGQTHVITIEYDGRRETADVEEDFDEDSLIVRTTCGEFKIGTRGVASVPCIIVEDWNAGIHGVSDPVCKPGGLRVQNPGSDTLVITAITGYTGTNFTLTNPTDPPLPIKLLPRTEVFINTLCYERSDVGQDSIDVVFTSNADGPFCTSDSISVWKGGTQAPGPNIIGYDWLKRRVLTLHPAFARVQNTGSQELTLTDVRFQGIGGKYWPAGTGEADYVFKIGRILSNGTPVTNPKLSEAAPEVQVEVFFRPAAVQIYSAQIEPVWAEASVPARQAELRGEGIKPTIETEGENLTCAQTPEGQPVITNLVIRNNGNADLTITNLRTAAGTDPSWQFVPPAPAVLMVPFVTGSNEVQVPIQFTRPLGNNGAFNLTVEFEHDAVDGNGVDTTITPVASTESFAVGSCSGPDIQVTDIDFGNNLANCDQPLRTFTITNTGGGNIPLEIRDIVAEGPDAAAFAVINIVGPGGTTVGVPFSLAAQQTATVSVRFTPTEPSAAPWAARNYNARFRIYNYAGAANDELVPDTYANMSGMGSVIQMTLALSHDREGDGVITPTVDNSDITYTIDINSAEFGRAQLTSLNVAMTYRTRSLGAFTNVRAGNALPANWTITGPVVTAIGTEQSRLEFQLSGPTPIVAGGDLVLFDATLLLGPEFIDTQNLEAELLRPCLIPTTTGTTTQITNCAALQRVVSIGETPYSFRPVNPNPVTSGKATVAYGVGINAPVVIDLINTEGQIVARLVNENLQAGEYELDFETTNLGNGVYFLRMRSADFTSTQQVVVGK